MGLSIFKLILILLIVFAIFGAGKLPNVMKDLGKGLKSFKDGLKSGDDAVSPRENEQISAIELKDVTANKEEEK